MPFGAALASPGFLCGLFFIIITFYFSPRNELQAPSPPVAVSVQLQTLHGGDNKYNPGRYCCKQHSWREAPVSFLSWHPPLPPNNSYNVTAAHNGPLGVVATLQSISEGFGSCPHPGEGCEIFATPSRSPARFGKGFGEGKGVWVRLTKASPAGHRPHRGSYTRCCSTAPVMWCCGVSLAFFLLSMACLSRGLCPMPCLHCPHPCPIPQ